jgi:hypothetical protein
MHGPAQDPGIHRETEPPVSCPRERALALYVGDDLSPAEVPELQAHVLDCATCRSFLLSLEASQSLLRELAEAPVPDEALAAVCQRLLTPPRKAVVSWRWVAAAAVAALLTPLLYVALAGRTRPTAPGQVAVATPPPATAAPAVEPPPAPARVPDPPPKPGPTRRSAPARGALAMAGLTAEEADQLARAVVIVSKIETLSDYTPDSNDADARPLVQIASDDPNVTIYWQLEPTGGK